MSSRSIQAESLVDVAVPLGVRKTFAYSVPGRLQARIACGTRVLVPFGRKVITGFVVGFPTEPPEGVATLRAIREVLDPEPLIPPALVETALWIADHYFTPPGEVLRAAFPAGIEITSVRHIRLSPRAETLMAGGLRPPALRREENLLLETLARSGPMSLEQLAGSSGVKNAARWIGNLSDAGWILLEDALRRPRVAPKEQLGIRALGADDETVEKLTYRQRELYSQLDPDGNPVLLQDLLRDVKSTAAVAQALVKKGLVEIAPMKLSRLPLDLAESVGSSSHTLTPAQQKAFDQLRQALLAHEESRFLLHGVTGSGKTEIYLRLIAEVLHLRQTALFLVPEIGLTPLLSRIAVSHFPEQVALLHSGMSAGERFDQWNRIRSGAAPVVVGTRSAVFAPLEGLRLIILDEEQDSSYKQDESPYYHARDVAWHRVRRSSGLLLMGSATPSVETFYAAQVTGEVAYLSLPERIEARPLADVAVVDMSLEFQRHGKNAVVSETLRQELDERLRRREQAIVLLNRRGYSRTLLCRGCGHSFVCPDCSIAMTYHQQVRRLICHYCGTEKNVPSNCANCGGEYIYFVGVGTEQLEEILRSMFPKARIARVDRDTTRRRGVLRRILLEFADHKLDMLVGTQILAKGHDFPNVTLVGVIAADAGLSFPDFRSAERTFQLLTQVAGRAGRGKVPGKVVIQSFYPDHYALRFARKQDFAGFFEREIEYRRLLGYPPFMELVQILVADPKPAKAMQLSEKISTTLKSSIRRHGSADRLRVLGPAAAPLEKLRGKYRYQLLVKASAGGDTVAVLRDAFRELGARRVSLKSVHVDVDPLSLL